MLDSGYDQFTVSFTSTNYESNAQFARILVDYFVSLGATSFKNWQLALDNPKYPVLFENNNDTRWEAVRILKQMKKEAGIVGHINFVCSSWFYRS